MQPSNNSQRNWIHVEVDPDREDLIPVFLDNRRSDAQTLERALQTHDDVEIALTPRDPE